MTAPKGLPSRRTTESEDPVIEQLRRIRIAKGIHQQEIADALHLSKSSITQYENGKRRPLYCTVRDWADYLGARLGLFIVGTEREPSTDA